MPAREWLRRPGHLLVAFLVVTLVPVCALGVLGWRLYQQDVTLEMRYLQDRLEHAADRAVASLEVQFGRLQNELSSAGAVPLDGDIVWVTFTPENVEVRPSDRILYYPPARPAPGTTSRVFFRGEALEFESHDSLAASAFYRQLAASPDAATRAGALLRLGRMLRSSGRHDEAMAVYSRMALTGSAFVEAGPAELVARRARSEVLRTLGRRREADAETAALLADLRTGRWRLDRSTFEFHAQALASRLENPGAEPAEALALSAAVAMLWERYRGLGAVDAVSRGWQGVWIDGRPMLLVWEGTKEAMQGLAMGRGWLEPFWRALPVPDGMALALIDVGDRLVMGPRPSLPGPAAVRRAADTALPWTVKIASTDPASDSGRASARRMLLLAGLAMLSLLVAGGGALVWRTTARELAVAELQSDFVAAVSHEFRTPLTSLRHLTELLEDGVITSESARREYYSLLSQETRRLHRLVEALLNFARMETGRYHFRLEGADPGRLVTDVVEEFKRERMAVDVAIELRAVPGLICQIDRESLSLAVWNLLDNAVKYSGACRTIKVGVERRGGLAAIAVRDGGPGIAPREQKAIFEKFVRGDAARLSETRGTGLGLALVRRIVGGHGGAVEVESELGKGSTFTILLPTAGDDGPVAGDHA